MRNDTKPARLRDTGALSQWELFDAIDEGFCVVEVMFEGDRAVDYRFVEANPSFVSETGLHDAVGKTMRELQPEHEDHWFEIYGRIARTGIAERFEQPAAHIGDRWYNVFAFRVGLPEQRSLPFCSGTKAHASAWRSSCRRASTDSKRHC
jgi:hypothetical protein